MGGGGKYPELGCRGAGGCRLVVFNSFLFTIPASLSLECSIRTHLIAALANLHHEKHTTTISRRRRPWLSRRSLAGRSGTSTLVRNDREEFHHFKTGSNRDPRGGGAGGISNFTPELNRTNPLPAPCRGEMPIWKGNHRETDLKSFENNRYFINRQTVRIPRQISVM